MHIIDEIYQLILGLADLLLVLRIVVISLLNSILLASVDIGGILDLVP